MSPAWCQYSELLTLMGDRSYETAKTHKLRNGNHFVGFWLSAIAEKGSVFRFSSFRLDDFSP